MTTKKFSNALGNIGESYVDEAATYTAKKKANPWMKWASIAACLALVFVSAILSGNIYINPSFGDVAMDMAVIDYGPFIFVPILLMSLIALYFSFTKRTTKTMAIVNIISLITLNILNTIGVYLYSNLGGGINITGELPNILIGFNAGAIFFIITHTLLDRKAKTWWVKLLLWTLIAVISIVVACIFHNWILILTQGGTVTIA